MTAYCRYHSQKPAYFGCPQCGSVYCDDCVQRRKTSDLPNADQEILCPKCLVKVSWSGVSNIIDPFWKRLPGFFKYPLSRWPMSLNIVLSLAGLILAGDSLFGKLIQLIVFAVVLKYSYSSLKCTAKGDLRAPAITLETVSRELGPVFKQFAMYFIIFYLFSLVLGGFGLVLGIIYLVLATVFIPAMVMLLVTTGSLFHAINPLLFVPLVARIGWPYLLLYVFLSLLGSAPAFLAGYLSKILPPKLLLLSMNMSWIYYTIISYHLMGYVLLQYHKEIGYEVNYTDLKGLYGDVAEVGVTTEIDLEETVLLRVNQLLKEGDHNGALEHIQTELSPDQIHNLPLSERYFKLMVLKNRVPEMVTYGAHHLQLLAEHDQSHQAREVYQECIKADYGFAPDPLTLFKVAGWSNAEMAVETYNRLARYHPHSDLVPKAFLRSAQLFHDRFLDAEKAIKLLHEIISHFPDHEILPRVKKYLKHIENES